MSVAAVGGSASAALQVVIIVAAALILTLLGGIGRSVRKTWHEQRQLPDRFASLQALAQSTNERTEQLERRNNGHLADVVHRIDTKLDAHHKAIDGRLEKVEAGLDESRRMAGQAATLAARTDQVQRELRDQVEDLRTRIWDHVRESEDRAAQAEARNYFHEGALRELGVPVDDWHRPPDDIEPVTR